MLSDNDINKALEDKLIEISPLDISYIQPSSVDSVSYTHLTLPTTIAV